MKFEIYPVYRYRFVDDEGFVIAESENSYETKEDAHRAIEECKKHAATATITDNT